jgi:hypothetical protein
MGSEQVFELYAYNSDLIVSDEERTCRSRSGALEQRITPSQC